jgi:hypothetical protein
VKKLPEHDSIQALPTFQNNTLCKLHWSLNCVLFSLLKATQKIYACVIALHVFHVAELVSKFHVALNAHMQPSQW